MAHDESLRWVGYRPPVASANRRVLKQFLFQPPSNSYASARFREHERHCTNKPSMLSTTSLSPVLIADGSAVSSTPSASRR